MNNIKSESKHMDVSRKKYEIFITVNKTGLVNKANTLTAM